MNKVKGLLRNRDFILILALALGLVWGGAARWTKDVTIPALAVAMTISTLAISGSVFRSPKTLLTPALTGIAMSYALLSATLLGLNELIIREEDLWRGFVIVAAVPPAIAVIPFTGFLNGNTAFSLIGSVGGYLGALVITPLMAGGFFGTAFIDPAKLVAIMVELIILPLIISRILLWSRTAKRIEPVKGTIINWSFFVVVYTVVGLNRDVFLGRPLSLLPVVAIAAASTFLLGWIIERVGLFFRIDSDIVTSLVLLGTLKNYGLAAGLSLALFSEQTAVPATVSAVMLIVCIIWLGLKRHWR
jgi:BASS family bile acid:Na+ symporter